MSSWRHGDLRERWEKYLWKERNVSTESSLKPKWIQSK